MSSSIFGVALSGLHDADLRIAASAHNSANALTSDFVPRQVVSTAIPTGGVSSRMVPQANPDFDARLDETTMRLSKTDLVDEVASSMIAAASFKANLATLQTAADLDQALMNIKA